MKINNFIYKTLFFNKITLYENNILLNKKVNIEEKYSNEEILKILIHYGKEILKIVPKTFIKDNKIEKNKISELLNLFVEFYNDVGYIQLNTDVYNKKNSFVLVPLESIFTLTIYIIKFYIFYELYCSFENLYKNTSIINENMNLLLDNFNMNNYSKMYLLNIISNELKNCEKRANLELNFKINNTNIAIPTFNIICNDLYILGMYILSDELLVEDVKKYIKCKHCNDIIERTSVRQIYCSSCSEKVNYGENTNHKKIEIIKEIITYKDKVNFANKYQMITLKNYCNLINEGNSRQLLNTKKKDLLDFLETVKKQYEYEHKK